MFYKVDAKSVGESKAKSVCAFLQELNDAVNANFVEENPDSLILTNPSFFSQFTLVIATQVMNRKELFFAHKALIIFSYKKVCPI